MKLLNFNIVHLAVSLILGIVIQNYLQFPFKVLLGSGCISVLAVIIFNFRSYKSRLVDHFYSLAVAIVFFVIGAVSFAINSPQNITHHYTKYDWSGSQQLVLKIEKRIKPGTYHDKYYAQLMELNGQVTTGRLLINIEKDSILKQVPVDAIILSTSKIQEIRSPLNPHQFDYAKYLKNHHIYHQVYLNSNSYIVASESPTTIYGYTDKLRRRINTKLNEVGFNSETIQMINALILGQKQDIDPDIYNSYINVGTVHILAVSGLHVGIILLILTWLFKPFLYLKYGRLIRVSLILVLLWGFAFVAGLSPSVTRSVTMFSLVSFAMHLKRETNIFNTLITSAFILLLINPNILFEVGFQLSYSAVLSIVLFQPLICSIWKPKYKLSIYLWQIFGVTLAAQLGVAPLSLYYFHQFPGLFFVSNLVVVPLLGLILGLGLLVIILSLFNVIPAFLVEVFEQIIHQLNSFIAWVAQFESFLLKDIPFDRTQLALCIMLISSLYWVLKSKQFRWISIFLTLVICFQLYNVHLNQRETSDLFIIFNKSRHSVVGKQINQSLIVHSSLPDSVLRREKFIKNYKVSERIQELETKVSEFVYQHQSTKVLAIDSAGVYKDLSFKPDVVLLSHSPKINLERMIKALKPKSIVADGSNYKSYVNRWERTCNKQNTTFHYTAKDGAFILLD
ncbi:ComEC/Rec2 family competence protein [Winogradskyella aurantiaca]|uniref:ComEC/Rec2 family competence protein n=1 Tax=Winogradskyella aurantiaca TaxID=2219558 RepID=UPI000E1D12D9|nr:ComEC/Rec2 family competence protein [Winogradskyella aurantiaca]